MHLIFQKEVTSWGYGALPSWKFLLPMANHQSMANHALRKWLKPLCSAQIHIRLPQDFFWQNRKTLNMPSCISSITPSSSPWRSVIILMHSYLKEILIRLRFHLIQYSFQQTQHLASEGGSSRNWSSSKGRSAFCLGSEADHRNDQEMTETHPTEFPSE